MATETPFGQYTLLDRLGRGGMGETWRAVRRDPHGVTKDVAIKRILRALSSHPGFVEAFINEAKVSTRLSHANVAQVFEFGQVDGEHYMAMELVQGRSLAAVLDRAQERGLGALPPSVAVFVVSEILKGLHHAHTRADEHGHLLGIVHRDVSPDNVLVGWEGEVKLVDFGIAKARLEGRTETVVGTVKGKPQYLSPEQARGEKVDALSDVFSAGVLLYRLVTGRHPVTAEGQQLMVAIANGALVPIAEVMPGLDPELSAAIERALQPERTRRFATAAAFQQALAPVLHRLGGASPQSLATGLMSHLFGHELTQLGRTVVVPAALVRELERLGSAPAGTSSQHGTAPGVPPRTTGVTLRTAVVGNKWAALALPLLLLLGIAAWIVYSIIEEQSENVDDSVSRSTLLHTRGDAKAREVGPMPGAAPTTQPAPALDEELQLPAAPPK